MKCIESLCSLWDSFSTKQHKRHRARPLPVNRMMPVLDLRLNEAQLWAELYARYGLLQVPPVHVFQNSIYLFPTEPVALTEIQAKPIVTSIDRSLQEFHRREGTLELYIDPQHATESALQFGCGSTQVYKGIVFALATAQPTQSFLFIERIPYFAGHQAAVERLFPYGNARFQGFHAPSEVKRRPNEILVEFVTSPNNPTGDFRQ